MEKFAEYFQLKQAGSSVTQEAIAGLTTFLAMAYITVVNPAILSDAGMDFGAVFVATCLAAAIGCGLMGLLGKYPIAQAPGMGQNAFFTYAVVLGMGHTWQVALAAVFLSGIIFIILSLLPVREWLINSIPKNLKLGISAGIGLFLGIIALKNAAVIVDSPATLVQLGDLTAFGPLMCLAGFAIIASLSQRKMTGAVIIGMLIVTLIGWLSGQAEFKGIVSAPPSLSPVFLQLDLAGAINISIVTVIITMLIVDVFDTAGTLVAVANRAGLVDKDGKLKNLNKTLLSDSTATAVGALLGTSSTTSFIESAAGAEAGGRTGLTAIVCALLFLLCLFFSPLAQSVPSYATSAALLFVACLMARSLADVQWDDHTESAPAVIAAITMPLGYSIADGIGLGFISYAAIKLLSLRVKECPSVVYFVALIFIGKFAFL